MAVAGFLTVENGLSRAASLFRKGMPGGKDLE